MVSGGSGCSNIKVFRSAPIFVTFLKVNIPINGIILSL
jgi:hypothetical protein